MTLYTYKCGVCKRVFDEWQSMDKYTSSTSLHKVCPYCKKLTPTSRVIHAPTIIFKGAGFYSVDNNVKPG